MVRDAQRTLVGVHEIFEPGHADAEQPFYDRTSDPSDRRRKDFHVCAGICRFCGSSVKGRLNLPRRVRERLGNYQGLAWV